MSRHLRRVIQFLAVISATALLPTSVPTAFRATSQTITVWTDSGNDDQPLLAGLIKAFEATNPNIHVKMEVGPSGVPAVNLVKSRLAKGTTDDVFVYYTSSLFQALDPARNLVNPADEPWQTKVISFFSRQSQ